MPYSDFISQLIIELFINEKLNDISLRKWVEFFKRIVEEDSILENASIKAKAHTMLAYMLRPLTYIIQFSEVESSNLDENFKLVICTLIERIMKNIEISFRYQLYSVDISKHLMFVVTNSHKLFVKDVESLEIFESLLKNDDRNLLALALNTLTELCQIESLQQYLVEFFFSDSEDETMIDKILSLINHRSLKSEVIQLFTALALIEQDFLDERQRYELFSNIFNKSKKISAETAALMTAMNSNFWLDIIKMTNLYLSPKDVDIPYVLSAYQDRNASESLFEILSNNIEDESTSERAAEMLIIALKMEDEEKMFSYIHKSLKFCAVNPRVAYVILKAFTEINSDNLENYYRKHANELDIIDFLANIFDTTKELILLKMIVEVLYKFFGFVIDRTLIQLFQIARKYSKAFRSFFADDNLWSIIRLSALLECRYWQILTDCELMILSKTCIDYISNSEGKSEIIHPHVMRLYVNVLKHIWVKLVTGKKTNFNLSQLASDILTYKKGKFLIWI